MSKRRTATLLLFALLSTNLPAAAQQPTTPQPAQPSTPGPQVQVRTQTPAGPQADPTPDPNHPVRRIRDEGLNRSQVMETLMYLTDVIGPRLTGSPQMKRANEWTRDKLASWGLVNAKLEPWGPFGRGWSLRRFSAEVVEPQGFPLIAYPKAWSPGLAAPLTAEVVYIDANDAAGLEKYRGNLRGKIVLASPVREVKAHFEPEAERLTEKQLLDLANAPDPATRQQQRSRVTPEMRAVMQFNAAKLLFFQQEGAAMVLDAGRGDGGTLFVQGASVPQPVPADPVAAFTGGPGAPRMIQARDKDAPAFAPQVVVAIEHYNRLVRMVQAGEKVRLAVNLEVQFHDQDLMGYNTVAEIPGSDPRLREEVVMLGGHMDSWHGGTGATDNAAGVAVAMEAVRIIKTLNLQPRRTVRVALWTGEEQGLLGSRAYVKEHFGELVMPTPQPGAAGAAAQPAPQQQPAQQARLVTKPGYDKFSAYFNLDNGTGRIRGVYMQGNSHVWPIFRQWLSPFADLGAQTLTMANTGGTDHLAFDAIGLPGFQFIQDEIEYDTRTHHSNMDVYDRIQADDMKQAAVIMAAFVYNAAMRDDKLPRKPAPGRPAPAGGATTTETVGSRR